LKRRKFQTIDEVKEKTLKKLPAETDYKICLLKAGEYVDASLQDLKAMK